jgi:pimeloyl-ACP methyl ester carboxylesterase
MNRVARVLRHIQQARLPTDPATAAADAHDDFIPALEDIPRTLPPPETDGVVSEDAKAALAAQCTALRERMAGYASHELLSDVGALVKSVEWAVCFGEWYAEGDDEKAKQVLAEAERRLADIDRGDWGRTSGAVVRGYRSDIDGSDQPYGLEVPDEAPPERGYPLFVWLHGRGNTATDMHFIHERMSATANAASGGRARPTPAGALVLHPFGRHCVGWKWAGEIDVLDAVAHVQANYNVDPDRIVLAGFSMGGAGAWHIGAHYPVPWCGLHTGAGFVETKRYNSPFPGPPSPTSAGPGGKPYPAGLASVPWYEKVLWGLYDVPNYTRSLLNRPLIVYSGQMDAQMQAALVMQEAFEAVDGTIDCLVLSCLVVCARYLLGLELRFPLTRCHVFACVISKYAASHW